MNKPDWEGFGRKVMSCWPETGIDGGDIQDFAEEFNILIKVPGGYNPDKHGNDEYSDFCEPGDTYYERNYGSIQK